MINNINILSNITNTKPNFVSWFVILFLLAVLVIGIRYYFAKKQ